jgi:hypothetical protein
MTGHGRPLMGFGTSSSVKLPTRSRLPATNPLLLRIPIIGSVALHVFCPGNKLFVLGGWRSGAVAQNGSRMKRQMGTALPTVDRGVISETFANATVPQPEGKIWATSAGVGVGAALRNAVQVFCAGVHCAADRQSVFKMACCRRTSGIFSQNRTSPFRRQGCGCVR